MKSLNQLIRRLYTALFIMLFLLTANYAQDTKTLPDSDIRVMTFNIRYGTANDGENSWQFRDKNVFTTIKKYDPDLVGLQEALKFQIDEILAALPEYSFIGVGRDDGIEAGEYCAILFKKDKFIIDTSSTFWFSETPAVPGSKHWGNNVTRICTWADFTCLKTEEKLSFYNVHLDHESQNARINSTKMLMASILTRQTIYPTIITGDFNATENTPEMMELRNRFSFTNGATITDEKFFLKDCFRMMVTRLDNNGTFHDFKGSRDGDRIDFIFVSNKFDIKESNIIVDSYDGKFPSDHFPVTASVNIKK